MEKLQLRDIRVELSKLKVRTRGLLERKDFVRALVGARLNGGMVPEPTEQNNHQLFVRVRTSPRRPRPLAHCPSLSSTASHRPSECTTLKCSETHSVTSTFHLAANNTITVLPTIGAAGSPAWKSLSSVCLVERRERDASTY